MQLYDFKFIDSLHQSRSSYGKQIAKNGKKKSKYEDDKTEEKKIDFDSIEDDVSQTKTHIEKL